MMTFEEIKAKIDAKVEHDHEKEKHEFEMKSEAYAKQVSRLKEIQPRIQKILDTFAYARDVNIDDIFRRAFIDKHWSFMAEGIHHRIGIMRDPRFMGVYAGGACGSWDFFVDGTGYFMRHHEEGYYNLDMMPTRDIKYFCDNFDKYESAFYSLIEHLVEE